MRISSFVLIIILFGACGKSDERPDAGTLDQNIYKNEFFGITVVVPNDWHIQNRDEIQAIEEAGKRRLGDDMAEKIDSAENNIQQLLTVLKYSSSDTSQAFNPSFIMMSERLPPIENFDERAYLALTRQQLQSTGIYEVIDDKTLKETIGGREFHSLRVNANQPGVGITQEFFTRLHDGYALILIASYSNKDERNELRQVFKSIVFD